MAKRKDIVKQDKQAVDPVELQKEIDSKVSKTELQEFTDMLTLRNNIINYYGIRQFITDLRNSILDSDDFYFTSEEDERIVSSEPNFLLSLTDDGIKKYTDRYGNKDDVEQFNTFSTNLILDEIVSPVTDKIYHTIVTNKEIKKNLEVLPEKDRVLILSSMYLIGAINGLKDNKISVRLYF